MKRWRWRAESPQSRTMEGARLCRRIWQVESPFHDLAFRFFFYDDGEVTLYRGPRSDGAMTFAYGLRGPAALSGCMRELRELWADRLARAYAGLEC